MKTMAPMHKHVGSLRAISDKENDVIFKTAREMTHALQSREISAVELFDEAVTRIERYDGLTNAVVVRDFERAHLAAAEADKSLPRGPDAHRLC